MYLIGSSDISAFVNDTTYDTNEFYAWRVGDTSTGVNPSSNGTVNKINMYFSNWNAMPSIKVCLYEDNAILNSVVLNSSIGTGFVSFSFPDTPVVTTKKYKLAFYLLNGDSNIVLKTKVGDGKYRALEGSYASPAATLTDGSWFGADEFYWSAESTETSIIDSYPETVRAGSTGNSYSTTGLSSASAVTIGDLSATSISDAAGDGTHSVPGLTDETVYELFGTKTVTITGDGGSPTTSTIFLPQEGYDFVELGNDINDTETGAVFEFDPVAAEGDQLAKPEALGIDEHADILGDDGVYTVWHIQASTKIARSYILTLGPPGDNPAVMPADTSVNVTENTTSVGTFAASSGSSPITYSLGGTDAALFSINASTGVVAFLSAPNFESGNNTRNITVTATNAHGNDSQNITVNVTNVVESPVMPADRTKTVTVGKTNVGNSGASFVDGSITYSKSGANHALFNINASTGALTFISPAEIGNYSVTVTATNSAGNDSQNLTINVIEAQQNSQSKFFTAKFF